jgi:hypothetical protein
MDPGRACWIEGKAEDSIDIYEDERMRGTTKRWEMPDTVRADICGDNISMS